MQTQRFRIGSYLAPGDHFHFARKALDPRPPRVLHDHDYFELFLIERGRARHWINGQVERISAGRFVFMRPTDLHAFQATGSEGCRIVNVMFPRAIAAHLLRRYHPDVAGRFFWSDAALPDAYDLEGAAAERAVNSALELQNSIRSRARIEGFLLNVITRVIDHAIVRAATAPQWLVATCEAARQPEVFRRGAAGFVAAAGRGHEHVCRQARRHLGLSPSAFVNRIRMQHAAMMLSDTDMTIPDVAADCGLENVSHFYTLFRGHYGSTPRAYRQRHRMDPLHPA